MTPDEMRKAVKDGTSEAIADCLGWGLLGAGCVAVIHDSGITITGWGLIALALWLVYRGIRWLNPAAFAARRSAKWFLKDRDAYFARFPDRKPGCPLAWVRSEADYLKERNSWHVDNWLPFEKWRKGDSL